MQIWLILCKYFIKGEKKMKKNIERFLSAKSILWNEGKAVALAWFNEEKIVINKGTNLKIRSLIKELNSNKFGIEE